MEYIINSKKYGRKVVLLDEEDYKNVINEKYSLSLTYDKTIKNFYVAFTKKPSKGNSRLLHRYIMQPAKGMTIDHINHNPLDNRRCNLKVCTQFENNQNQSHNTSGKVGVSYCKRDNLWVAHIRVNNRMINLGWFKDFDKAVECRLKAENKYFPSRGVMPNA